MLLQKFIDDSDHSPAQAVDVSKFSHVHTRQLFRQDRLVAGGKTPVSEIVGKALADKMMFLQRPESVLKDGIVGASLQRLPQFGDVIRLLPSDSQQVFRR